VSFHSIFFENLPFLRSIYPIFTLIEGESDLFINSTELLSKFRSSNYREIISVKLYAFYLLIGTDVCGLGQNVTFHRKSRCMHPKSFFPILKITLSF